jgi:hypothetical protein
MKDEGRRRRALAGRPRVSSFILLPSAFPRPSSFVLHPSSSAADVSAAAPAAQVDAEQGRRPLDPGRDLPAGFLSRKWRWTRPEECNGKVIREMVDHSRSGFPGRRAGFRRLLAPGAGRPHRPPKPQRWPCDCQPRRWPASGVENGIPVRGAYRQESPPPGRASQHSSLASLGLLCRQDHCVRL